MKTPGLWKTAITVWSRYPGDTVPLAYLARQAEEGDAYCSWIASSYILSPDGDPGWDGTEFFLEPDDGPGSRPGHEDAPRLLPAEPQETGRSLYVLTISHRHGDDTSLHDSASEACGSLADFARRWWHEIAGRPGVSASPPGSDAEAVRVYFENKPDEHHAITAVPLTARCRADAEALDIIAETPPGPGMPDGITTAVARTGRTPATRAGGGPRG